MGTVPFIFCRYMMQIGEEILDHSGTYGLLSDRQGQFFARGPTAEAEGIRTLVIMRPRQLTIGEEDVVVWAMGHRPGHRTTTDYDSAAQEIKYRVQSDTHILHTEVVAIPRLGAMAVMDRSSALHAAARPSLNRIRAFFRQIDDGAFTYTFLAPGDITQVLDELTLKEYSYTVRRINPTPPSALAEAMHNSLVAEGIAISRGVAVPAAGEEMVRGEGPIGATSDLAAAGYGVIGAKGLTANGRLAQIRKPPFSMDKKENLEQQEKEQPLRVFFDDEEQGDDLIASVVGELVRFYGGDDAPDVPEVSA